MAYCEIKDVIHELHPTLLKQMQQHYDRLHEADENNLDFKGTIAEHIVKAEACANASLARAYAVPLRSATKIVTSAVCKIAAYFSAAAFAEKEEILKDKYETANQMLDQLVEANNAALVDEEPLEDALSGSGVGWGSDRRIFTERELRRW